MAEPVVTIGGKDADVSVDEMDIRVETDKFGKTIKFQIINGRHYCLLYHPDIFLNVPKVEMRSDDIYLCAYPRTGTHWTYELICMLLNGKPETIQKFKGENQLEFTKSDIFAAMPSPRLINTHERLSMAPRSLAEKKCKVVYPIRDPKDVAVSLYHAYRDAAMHECTCSFEGFLQLFLEGKVEVDGLFPHYRDAEKFADDHPEIAVYFQIYEETQKDPVASVQKLSDFLGVPRNDDLCRAIADKCQFSKMVVDKDSYSMKVEGRNMFYRKGKVGDWVNHFTDKLLDVYYRFYEQHMKGSRFYDRYSRNRK